MTIKDTILAYLSGLSDGATDSEIQSALEIKHHAQVNHRCRQLQSEGLIERREVGQGRFKNFYAMAQREASLPARANPAPPIPGKKWFWEGNVQARLVRYLVLNGWDIDRVADTTSRETGRDVIASKAGRTLWASVKGYPVGTERTRPPVQAQSWFKNAFFELAKWRGESQDIDVLLVLPDYPTYRTLAGQVSWVQPQLRYSTVWIAQDGNVAVEPDIG